MSKKSKTPEQKATEKMLATCAEAQAVCADTPEAKAYRAARVRLAIEAAKVAVEVQRATRTLRANAAIDDALATADARIARASDILASDAALKAAGLATDDAKGKAEPTDTSSAAPMLTSSASA